MFPRMDVHALCTAGPGIVTVSQFIWQLDVVAVAHVVMDCFDLLHAPDDGVSDDSSNQP